VTFQEAFDKFPFDVERIAELLGMPPHEADREINEAMDRRYAKRMEYSRKADVRRPA
jgi:hypothetical protein